MEIIITNKAAYVMIFFLALLVIGMGVNARVDLSKAYHTLQDIVKSNDPSQSVDRMGDGIIDEADEPLNINWYDMKNFPSCTGEGPSGEDKFLTGFLGGVPTCNTLGVTCTGTNLNTNCQITPTVTGSVVNTGLSVTQNFVPQYALKTAGSLWVSLLPEAAQFTTGLLVKLSCLSAGNCPSTTEMYNISGPRQVDTYNLGTYVGTDQANPSGKFYKIDPTGCIGVTTNVDGLSLGKAKSVIANAHGVFVLDELREELNKYTLELIPVSKVTIPNPEYMTEGTFGGITKLLVLSQGLTESYVKIYDAATLTLEETLAVPGALEGITLDDAEKMLFLPQSTDIVRYPLNYVSGTYTLGSRTVLPITHLGIKTLYAANSQLYLPLHLENKISVYNAANTATPVLLADITTADLSGTMLDCDDASLCGPITVNGEPYPPQTNSQIGTGITTTPQAWQYITGTPGVCQFTCTGGKTYVPATNSCGETWYNVGVGTTYNCAAATDPVTHTLLQAGDSCDTTQGDTIKYYCSNCNADQTSCDYDKFECRLN